MGRALSYIQGAATELTLSADDARILRDVFSDHVPELRLEVARTDAKDFRHMLVLRLELTERLLAQLERELARTST